MSLDLKSVLYNCAGPIELRGVKIESYKIETSSWTLTKFSISSHRELGVSGRSDGAFVEFPWTGF